MNLSKLKVDMLKLFLPPKKLSVSQWADENRVLSSVNSAEPGRWRTDRAPYQREIMDAFSEDEIQKIVIKASAQCGKSEILNNCLGYIISHDPGPCMMVQPTEELAKGYSKERIAPMIEASPALKDLISEVKTRDSGNTILSKNFPGGFLSLVGANAPSGLRSRPIRYLLLDEVDAFPKSAGSEGDPVKLAMKRTQTFHNRKVLMCSTPTIKNLSKIDREYKTGTQEEWCVCCPSCEEFIFIDFKDIDFKYKSVEINGSTQHNIENISWKCPNCGELHSEKQIKKSEQAWVCRNEQARNKGIRSFRINAFLSPWQSWEEIVKAFLDAKDNNEELQVFYNTVLGEVWEIKDRSGKPEKMLDRREHYVAEVPKGVLVLTCGIDTQDNRLEYEVVGWGRNDESWGIMRGVIPGVPDADKVWEELDKVIDREFDHGSGQKIKISASFIDSGGHYTQEVYKRCAQRHGKYLFAIKGRDGQGYPYVERSKGKQLLFLIGVDSGKAAIMQSLEAEEGKAKYCHFPIEEERGYNIEYFKSLMSEKIVVTTKNARNKLKWEKIEGVVRNEMLDCRNYARAAYKCFPFDLNRIEKRLMGDSEVNEREEKKIGKSGFISRGIKV